MSRPFLFVSALVLSIAVTARAEVVRQVQVEGRGPLHEAYAQPWNQNPRPNEAVAEKPPEPVAEEPPDDRPPGDGVQWIPGYWQWDDDKKDFVWVSGLWRDAPNGRRWVQGYWANTAEGWRWVNGHWAADQEQDNQYVPNPPTNDDQGPRTRAPDADSFYIPGTWFYSDNGYGYRDGYWADIRPGYSWVPARYIWSPNGWIFASGFWDLAIGSRGLLFAPVYFGPRVGGFGYRPSVTLAFGAVANSLFVRPNFGHYYFGDFYARSYIGAGFQPWANFASRQYDPIFAYERWANRGNAQWLSGLHATYTGRANGTLAAPPRTFADQARLAAGARSSATLMPLDQLRQSGQRLVPLSTAQRSTQVRIAQQMVQRSVEMTRSTLSHSSSATGNARTQHNAVPNSSIAQGFTQPRSGGGPTTSFKPAPSASGSIRSPSNGVTQRPVVSGNTRSYSPSHVTNGGVRLSASPSFNGGRGNGGHSSPGGRTGGGVGHTGGGGHGHHK